MNIKDIDICLSNTPTEYRSILTIPNDINFGLEIELEDVRFEQVFNSVRKSIGATWGIKADRSLLKDKSAEVVTPVLKNTKETWLLLQKATTLLSKMNPTFTNCSFQINYDDSLLPREQDKLKFIKLYCMFEDIIYRFSRGTDEKLRESLETYAYPLILTIKDINRYPDYILEILTNNKRYGLCFKDNSKSLIEFRTPNGTINPILWQNYITFFYYLIEYSKSSKCNERELDEYISNFNKTYILESYEPERKEKALVLSKRIFPKSIDRSYFLSQYLNQLR